VPQGAPDMAAQEGDPLLAAEDEYRSPPQYEYEPWVQCNCNEKAMPSSRWSSWWCISIVLVVVFVNYKTFMWDVDAGIHKRLIFNVLIFLLLASWVQTMITHPGGVSQEWSDRVAAAHKAKTSEINKKFDYMPTYKLWKPHRSHHDKTTKRIVLNMDHYCPWVFNTVGFANRKFFLLFVFYCWVTLLFAVLAFPVGRTKEVYNAAAGGDAFWMQVFGVLFFDTFLGMVLFGFWCWHVYLISVNSTSVEQQRRPPPTKYDIGCYRNTTQVFGPWPCLWPLPVWGSGPEGNGVEWPLSDGTVAGVIPDQNIPPGGVDVESLCSR